MVFSLFNHTLFNFKSEGETPEASKNLLITPEENKYVAKAILSSISMDDIPEVYGFGDEDEARYYAYYAQPLRCNTKGTITWLRIISATPF